MTIDDATRVCRETGLSDWDLVGFAQGLVYRTMPYSVNNSFDSPRRAYERGRGYCWQQAGALHLILKKLGFDSRMVHAVRNLFTDIQIQGVLIPRLVSGHVWCRVTIDGSVKDVCPGDAENRPGLIHFTPLTKVHNWNAGIAVVSYLGSAGVNFARARKAEKMKKKQIIKWNPETCPCKKKTCPRHKSCDACKQYHSEKSSLPYCER